MANRSLACILTAAILVWLPPPHSPAGDQPQWGERFSRNMVSAETGLADRFDPSSGLNIKWSVPLGSQTYSTPVISGGKVLIGTNNNAPRDPRHQDDRGVMMCFNQADGSLAWQLVVPKLEGDIYLDWPRAGICSPATVEGNRVYTVTNRDEVVCLDLHGMADGNDGPFQEEGRHMAGPAINRRWKPAHSTPTSSGSWTCGSAAGVQPTIRPTPRSSSTATISTSTPATV